MRDPESPDERADRLEQENEHLREQAKHVAVANAHAAQKMAEMSMQREQELEVQKATLEQALEAAEEASKQKSMFLANVSHELRTPLNGIIGMASVLLDHEPKSPDDDAPAQFRVQHLEMLLHSGERLLDLVNDLLDLSKVECGGLMISKAAFDVRRFVEDLVVSTNAGNANERVEVRLFLHEDVPQFVLGDELRLRQILINLVGNALKFTEEGTVDVTVSWIDESIHFAVRDTGCGIEEGVIENLFQPFVQVDSTSSRANAGTGLGLTICKRIAELMGGEITAASTFGEGSEFRVSLPLLPIEGAGAPETTEDAATGEPAEQPITSSTRVLVVDDDEINRRVARSHLERLGCVVQECVDGQAAVDAVVAGEFDLVLLDCQMPVMDGYEAARQMRELREGDVPFIAALTAHAMKDDRARCLEAGMDDYLTKPIRKPDLQLLLSRVSEPRP